MKHKLFINMSLSKAVKMATTKDDRMASTIKERNAFKKRNKQNWRVELAMRPLS